MSWAKIIGLLALLIVLIVAAVFIFKKLKPKKGVDADGNPTGGSPSTAPDWRQHNRACRQRAKSMCSSIPMRKIFEKKRCKRARKKECLAGVQDDGDDG